MNDSMLAIKKLENAAGMTLIHDAPIPEIGSRDVLIQVTHAGVCGTDRHIYEWDQWSSNRVKLGTTIGHEFVGRVAAVGDDVRRTSVGQRVSAEGHIGCGNCQPCRTGNGHICEHVDILGIDCDGIFAQYASVPEDNIWPVDPNIPDHIAAIFDPLGNAINTVMTAGVSGKSVLITGVGIIGLMAVTVCKAAGAGKIMVSDVNRDRMELAKKLGADQTFFSADDWVPVARELTFNQGPEVLLEMSGHPAAIKQGFTALRNGGTAALLGLPSHPVMFDLADDVIFKGVTIHGINGRRMFETWYQMESLVLSGQLDLEPIITHHLPMQDFDQAFQMMQTGEAIKVVLNIPHEEDLACQTAVSTSGARR